MPAGFIRRDGYGITAAARRYLEPLIRGEAPPPYGRDGLPKYVEPRNVLVRKKLAAWEKSRENRCRSSQPHAPSRPGLLRRPTPFQSYSSPPPPRASNRAFLDPRLPAMKPHPAPPRREPPPPRDH